MKECSVCVCDCRRKYFHNCLQGTLFIINLYFRETECIQSSALIISFLSLRFGFKTEEPSGENLKDLRKIKEKAEMVVICMVIK